MQTPPWSMAKVDQNVFATYSAVQTNFSGFDAKSIMIYAIPDEHTVGSFKVDWNTDLSDTDKQHIKVIYPGAVAPTYQVKLKTLKCNKKQELVGKDEVQVRLFIDGDKVAVAHPTTTPVSGLPIKKMGNDDVFTLNKTCNFTRSLRVEVWEIDNPNSNDPHDFFGVVMVAGSGPGEQILQDKAGALQIRPHKYTLKWE